MPIAYGVKGVIRVQTYYCVMSTFDDRGVSKGWLVEHREAESRPAGSMKETKHKDIYTDWFDSEEEAMKYLADFAKA